VSPKASLTEISGLDTLVSGNYINLQPGRDNNPLEESSMPWTALPRLSGPGADPAPDRRFWLGRHRRQDLFRGLEVGSVINTRLGEETRT
jgi:paraquat-inducible protein B